MDWIDPAAWLDELAGLDPITILAIVGALAFLESAAFTGLIVPGEATVLLGGALAGRGAVGVGWVIAVVAAAAVLGNAVAFRLGRSVEARLAGSRIERLVGAARLAAGADYMRRRGQRAILLGRFVPAVGAVIPFLAGASGMRRTTFLRWNIASAVAWSVTYVSAGYLGGESAQRLEGASGAMALVILIAALGIVARRRARSRPALAEASHADERGSARRNGSPCARRRRAGSPHGDRHGGLASPAPTRVDPVSLRTARPPDNGVHGSRSRSTSRAAPR